MALAMDKGMPLGIDSRTLRVVWTIVLVALALGLVYTLRHLLVILAFSVFFAYLLYPVVWRVEQRLPTRHRRAVALLLTYTALCLILVAAAMTVGPRLIEDVRGLARRFPAMAADLPPERRDAARSPRALRRAARHDRRDRRHDSRARG